MNKIKVVLSGLVFPFTMMHFFWRALERRSDIELFVLGPYSGDWIPWGGGMQLPPKYVKVPDLPLPQSASRFMMPSAMIERSLPWKPDLWLQCDAGWHLSNKPNAGCVALIETDPHVLKLHYEVPKHYSDITFCMQGEPYLYSDEEYLPYGFDIDIHYPENQEKIYDACLIGLHYETRNQLVNRLRQKELNVYYSIGEVYDDYRFKYNQSKVALCWSSLQDLPARFWEALAMRIPVVTNLVPDLKRFFVEDKHYLGFKDIDEAEQKVMKLLESCEYREQIAWNGYVAVQGHSWDHRVASLLKTCGF